MPKNSVPFGFSQGNINNNNSENHLSGQQNNLDVKKALVAFKNILSRSEWSNDEPEEEAGRMYDDDEEEDLYTLTTRTTRIQTTLATILSNLLTHLWFM